MWWGKLVVNGLKQFALTNFKYLYLCNFMHKIMKLSRFHSSYILKNLILGPVSRFSAPKCPKQEFCQRILSAAETEGKNWKIQSIDFLYNAEQNSFWAPFYPKTPVQDFSTKKLFDPILNVQLENVHAFVFRTPEKAHFGPLPGHFWHKSLKKRFFPKKFY